MSRVFLSHSSQDSLQAVALKIWLANAEPGLADEIFLDLDRDSGIPAGVRWKEALRRANDRCEAVICLLSEHWDASYECKTEYRTAEDRGKPIFPVRLEPLAGHDITSEWQRCDLFGDGPKTAVMVDGHDEPVEFLTEGLLRLRNGLRAAGIAPDSFAWPPDDEPDRVPYRGWQPLEAVDAAVYFGRDAEICRALTAIRGLRNSGDEKAFVILGPSGVGKSSFLRAGLLPRLRRDDRHFLPMGIVRPERYPLTGSHGLAGSIHALRAQLGLHQPALGTIKAGMKDPSRVRGWLAEAQRAAVNRLVDAADAVPPTIVLPVDQAEELFGAEAGDEAGDFLTVVAAVLRDGTPELPIIVVATVRADRYEPLQTAPQLAGLDARVFDDLKPMPQAQFREVICGPAARAAKSGARLVWAPELVDRLLADCAAGADALPLLSLTLARLYEDYGDGVVGLTEYEAMGGMRRVVETEIDGVLSADPDTRERELKQLHDAFIPWLVAINPANDEPLRRAARWVDLPADSHPLIEALVAKRLLVKDERDGTVVVEVALESLLRQWDTLAGWLRGEAADLKNTDAIEHAARDWEHNARHDDWLLPGERLAEAEALAAKPGFRDRLNASREYLLISRQRENRHADAELQKAHEHARALRRRSQLLMAVLAVTVVAAVVAAVGFVQASHARRDAEARARDATANELVAEAMNQLGNLGRDRDDLAMQLILAARTFPSNNPVEYPIVSALQTERDLLKIIDAHAWVNSVAYSPDGHRIAAAAQGADRTVQIWDADTGQPAGPPLRGHDKHVTSVAYRPDGHRLATASDDKTVRIWDADTGQPIGQPLRGHDDAVNSVAYSRDGHRLATASDDKTVRIWDADTGQPIGQPLRRDDPVWVVAFSPDGHRIASGGADNTVRLWDADTGQPIGEPLSSGQPGLAVTTVAFSPDGHRLAAGGGFDFAVHLFDTDSGQPAGQLSGHTGVVNSVAFSPYGRFIVTGSEDRTVRLWDAQTGQPLGAPFSGHQNAVTSVAFSPDGHRIASGAFDDTVRVWDTITGRPLIGHQDMVTRVAFSPDGHRVASASFDKTVRLWDPQTHQPIGAPLTGHEDWVTCVVYSPDGHRLATASADKTVRIWDADTLAPIGDPLKHDAPVIAAVFSPDGQHIATSSFDATMRLWDTRTGHLLTGPVHHDHQDLQLAFSPDGHRIVAGSWHNTVPIWDAQTLQPSGDPLVFGGGMVAAAAFSPDGTTIAATSNDGTIRLWNAQTGVGFGPALTGHTASVNSVAFSPDSRTIVTGSVDKTLRLWPVPTMSPEALCAKLTQNMSHKVWDYWVANIDYHTQCPGLPIPDDQR